MSEWIDDQLPGSDPSSEDLSALSLDYYRAKYREFQVLMNSLDASYKQAFALRWMELPDDALNSELDSLIADYESKRGWIKGTAEALNVAANAANSLGIRMPVLSTPQTLGAWPLVGVAAAVAAVAGVTAWGLRYLQNQFELAKRAQIIAAQSPEHAGAVALALEESANALDAATASPLAQGASIVKWIAIAAVGFFAYKAFAQPGSMSRLLSD